MDNNEDKKDQWDGVEMAVVKMIKNVSGAIHGLFVMNFEKGKAYKVDFELAKIFMKANMSTIIKGNESEEDIFKLHVAKGGVKSWIK